MEIRIPPHDLPGTLILPVTPQAVVAFAHGSGSGRFSPRNRQVAARLQQANLGTLLFDLLTEPEAGDSLPKVRAPTLLVVGGADPEVLMLNRAAARQLSCDHELAVVPHATHLFEEPGTLEQVQELAANWFGRHYRSAA